MRTVLIIGAGATRSEAHFKRFPLKRLPPLDTDFFQICKYHKVKENLETLKRYIHKEYMIDITKAPIPRMEEIFGLVYSDTRLKPPPSGAKEAYTALCRIYNRVLLETTNSLNPTSRGPLIKLIKSIMSKGRCCIITFNHDIVIEKALTFINKDNPIWFPDNGYFRKFEMFTLPIERGTTDVFQLSNGIESRISILKLHGSLNWYTLTGSQNLIPSTMTISSHIKCTRSISIHPEMTFTRPSRPGRRKWFTWPVIVPPVYEKGPFITETLASIWNAAYKEIEAAEQIIVFGYSFPQADQQGRSFFRRAIASNNVLKKIVIINTDITAAVVAKEIFLPPILITTEDVFSYIDANM